MISKWYELKAKALQLRRNGGSLRYVEKRLGIPRSTLSGWFKSIELTKQQRVKLHQNWLNALVEARKKSVVWHKAQKVKRLESARTEAIGALNHFKSDDTAVIELALAFLYLGEGFKSGPGTSLGNSSPSVLKFFVKALDRIYGLQPAALRAELHIRADQNPLTLKRFWSKALKIPYKNFRSVAVDLRTKGSVTYAHYKGVCVVRCGHAEIQRKLIAMANIFCEAVSLQGRIAQW